MICKYIAQGAIRVSDFKLMFAPKFNKDGWYILHFLSTFIYYQKNIHERFCWNLEFIDHTENIEQQSLPDKTLSFNFPLYYLFFSPILGKPS